MPLSEPQFRSNNLYIESKNKLIGTMCHIMKENFKAREPVHEQINGEFFNKPSFRDIKCSKQNHV